MRSTLSFFCAALSVFLLDNLVNSYVMPIPGDCTKYQVCDYSGCFVFNCGIGTEFNPKILVCDYPLQDRGVCGSRGIPVNYNPGYPGPTNNNPYPGYPGAANPNPGNPGYPGYPGNSGAGSAYPGNPGSSGACNACPGNNVY